MKKPITIYLIFTVVVLTVGCSPYKYTSYQYDEAINAMYVGKHISQIQSITPYPLIGLFSDGKNGKVYKYDMSISYQTPSRSTTNTNINVNEGYTGNLTIYGAQNKTTRQSQTITQTNFVSLFTNEKGNIYKVDYLMSPRMLNKTYKAYKRHRGY
jgi:hypothetical protein